MLLLLSCIMKSPPPPPPAPCRLEHMPSAMRCGEPRWPCPRTPRVDSLECKMPEEDDPNRQSRKLFSLGGVQLFDKAPASEVIDAVPATERGIQKKLQLQSPKFFEVDTRTVWAALQDCFGPRSKPPCCKAQLEVGVVRRIFGTYPLLRLGRRDQSVSGSVWGVCTVDVRRANVRAKKRQEKRGVLCDAREAMVN